jgi:glycolate oxidase
MGDLKARLTDVVGRPHLLTGDDISDDYGHDEALNVPPRRPAYVAKPATAEAPRC